MKNRINKYIKIGVPIFLLFFVNSTTLAHGPEVHITEGTCSGLTQANWNLKPDKTADDDDAFFGACIPPGDDGSIIPDLSRGINHNLDANGYPSGLCFPSFNNYTDNEVDLFATPPWFPDETNFLKVALDKNVGPTVEADELGDDVAISPGDRILFYMYIHNDGDSCLNDNVFALRPDRGGVREADFSPNWRTTAVNTRIDFKPANGNFQVVDNIPQIVINQGTSFNAGIQATNAVAVVNGRNVVGAKNTDPVTLNLAAGVEQVTLKLDPDSFSYYDFTDLTVDEDNDGENEIEPGDALENIISPAEARNMVTGQMQLSTLHRGAIKGGGRNAGKYLASEPYMGMVIFAMEAEEEPKICRDIGYDEAFLNNPANSREVNGRTYHPIKINEVDFRQGDNPTETPENVELKFSSSDPNGDFLVNNVSSGNEVTVDAEEGVTVFYAGIGPVRVATMLNGVEYSKTCKLTIQMPALCEGITYNADFSDEGASTIDGRTYRPILIESIDFSNGIVPENARLRFTSTDPNGDFRTFTGSKGPSTEVPANAVSVLYAGSGQVTVKIINVDEAEEGVCTLEVSNNICESISVNFELNDQVGGIHQGDGIFAHLLQVDDVRFSQDVIPENARLRWTSDNPNGRFYYTFLGLTPLEDPRPTIIEDNNPNTALTVETRADNPNFRTLFYFGGDDNIHVEIFPDDIKAECEGNFNLDNPQICSELIINHNNPIIEGYVSRFSATALDEDGNPYNEGGGIRYSVNDGFGTFYDEQPPTPPMSPAPFVDGAALHEQEVQFSNSRTAWVSELMNNVGVFDATSGFNMEKANAKYGQLWDNNDAQLQQAALDKLFPTIKLSEEKLEEIQPDVPHINTPEASDEGSETFNWIKNSGPNLDPSDFDMKPAFGGIDISEQLEKNKVKTPNLKLPSKDLDAFDFGGTNSFSIPQNKGKQTKASDNSVIKPAIKPKPAKEPKPGTAASFSADSAALMKNATQGLKTIQMVPAGPIILAPAAAAEPVVARAGEEVYLDAEKGSASQDVVHVEQLGPDGKPLVDEDGAPLCSGDFPIEALVCRTINVEIRDFNNHILAANEALAPNMMYAVHALPVFRSESGFGPLYRQGSGVTYTVDDDYGVFVALNPTLVDVFSAMRQDGVTFADEAALRAFVTGLGQDADAFIVGNEYSYVGPNSAVAALITFDNQTAGRHANFLTVVTTGQNPAIVNPACSTRRNLEIPEAPICTNLNYEINGEQAPEEIAPNTVYNVIAESNFRNGAPEENTIRYSLNENYGVFILNEELEQAVRDGIAAGIPMDEAMMRTIARNINVFYGEAVSNEVTVAPGEEVTFVIYTDVPVSEDGRNRALIIYQNGFEKDGCLAEVNVVIPPELVCTELTTTITLGEEGEEVGALAPRQTYTLTSSASFTGGEPETNTVRYNSTNRNQGVFLDPSEFEEDSAAIYLEIVTAQGNEDAPFTRGTLEAILRSYGLDPATIMHSEIEVAAGEEVFFFTFDGAVDNANLVTVTQVVGADEEVGGLESCVNIIPFEGQPPEEPICIDLTYTVDGQAGTPTVGRNGIFLVSATSTLENVPANVDTSITYTVDPAYGTIITDGALQRAVRDAITAGESITRARLEEISAQEPGRDLAIATTQQADVAQGETITILIYSDAPSEGIANAIIIQQNGEGVADLENCNAHIAVPPEELMCVDLSVATQDGTPFNPANPSTEFVVTGNFQDHNGQIEVAITEGGGTLQPSLVVGGPVGLVAEVSDDGRTIVFSEFDDEDSLEFSYVRPANFDPTQRVTITVRAIGDANLPEGVCEDSISSSPEGLICIDLVLAADDLQRITNAKDPIVVPLERINANTIERNSVYEVSAASTFNGPAPVPNQLNYRLDPRYGVIVNPAHRIAQDDAVMRQLLFAVGSLQTSNDLREATLETLISDSGEDPNLLFSNDITVDANTTLTIITYSDAPLSATTLRIAQVGAGIGNLDDCIVEIPIPLEDICVDLSVNARGGAFNPRAATTTFEITGNFQGHDGQIVATITEGGGTISRLENNEQANQRSIHFFKNEVQSENVLVFVYHGDPNMARDARVIISVKAVGAPDNICQDTVTNVPEEVICTDLTITRPDRPWDVDSDSPGRQTFNIDVETDPSGNTSDFYYTWEATGAGEWDGEDSRITEQGRLQQTLENYDDNTSVKVWASKTANGAEIPACVDNIDARGKDKPNPPDKEKPEIQKVVYPRNNIEEADDLINISDRTKTKYVTYMAIFTPGSESKSVEIIEEAMKNGKIISTDGLGGYFKISDIEIIKIDKFNTKKPTGEIIYRTKTYKPDNDKSNPYSDVHYDDDSFIRPNVLKYDCSDIRDDRFCVEDLDKTIFNFGIGESGGIRFNHVEDIGTKGRIVIKYQMVNFSEIDEESCKTLSAMSGCGEKFRNIVSYISHEKINFEGRTEEGKDRAEAVVMCPYALSRQGGDVLFHDIIDSGVDVARCSPVKGSTGIGVKIIPVPEVETPSTGPDAVLPEDSVVLSRPTHDICKFSNQKAVKGDADYARNYNDELANFSSSVCELRAELSSTLYETSINDAIAANISRLTRWSSNLNGIDTLRTVDQLNDVENAASGVFVKTDGDLTIDASGLQIGATDVVKGGNQTYIVIGGNLIINGDVTYADEEPNYLKPRTIGSAAFIVIGGDIIVDKDVKEMAGIYMAVNVDAEGNDAIDKGQIKAGADEDSETPLVVNGGLYGNVNNLFSHRIGIGDPRYDEGSVTIKYDERLLLNMPPGIGELINVQQAIVPN